MGARDSGLENRDWRLGTRETGIGKPSADSGCRNQLSAIRLPPSEFAYRFFKTVGAKKDCERFLSILSQSFSFLFLIFYISYFDRDMAFSKVFRMVSEGFLSIRLTMTMAATEKKKPGTSS